MNHGEEHRWSTVRDQACDLFGDTPGAQLEADILEHFVEDPERVIRAIHRIADSDTAHSKWPVLRADLKRTAAADVIATNTKSQLKQIERAKQWIDNAGLHFDRQDQLEGELFGDDYTPGRIPNADAATRTELVNYWHEQRPRGEQAERDHIAWNETAKANRAILLERKARQPTPAEPAWRTTSDNIDFT